MFWNLTEKPRRARSKEPKDVTSRPLYRIVPAVGRSIPISSLKKVLLPAPLGPMMQMELAPVDGEIHTLKGGEATVLLDETAGVDDRVVARHGVLPFATRSHAHASPSRPCERLAARDTARKGGDDAFGAWRASQSPEWRP